MEEYNIFWEFINAFNNGNSYLTENEGLFTREKLENAKKPLIEFAIGKNKTVTIQDNILIDQYNQKRLNNDSESKKIKAAILEIALTKKLREAGKLAKDKNIGFYHKLFEQYNINNSSYLNEFKGDNYNIDDLQKLILAHVLFVRNLPLADINYITKVNTIREIIGVNYFSENSANIPIFNGVANYSRTKTEVYEEVVYLFDLLIHFKGSENAEINNDSLVSYLNDGNNINNLPIRNMLLYFCNTKNNDKLVIKYEPIAATNIKEKIVTAFKCLIEEDASQTTDQKIKLIKSKIMEITENKMHDFFDEQLQEIYNDKVDNTGFSKLSALKYKKAIVLYGPPGTSKTYSAKKLAEQLIVQDIIKDDNYKSYFTELNNNELNRTDSDKKTILKNYLKHIYKLENSDTETILNNITEKLENNIHYLQLHPNYTYEDFIWGYQIEEGKTIAKPGKLLQIVNAINNENESNVNKKFQKHVIILDEINRIDLSKLFGEFFSGIENRNEEIELSAEIEFEGGKKTNSIRIPENLYIIGTMNEIDFSLERLDFALRRRFVWFEHNFDKETLEEIIKSKIDNYKLKLDYSNMDTYVNRCHALNIAITKNDELGSNYQIGHTFFAEIIDIIASIKLEESKNLKINSDRVLNIIWNISIKPMLEAFLGNIDLKKAKELLELSKDKKNQTNFADIFIGNAKYEIENKESIEENQSSYDEDEE